MRRKVCDTRRHSEEESESEEKRDGDEIRMSARGAAGAEGFETRMTRGEGKQRIVGG